MRGMRPVSRPHARRRVLVGGGRGEVAVVDCVPTARLCPDGTVAVEVVFDLGALPRGWRYAVAFVRGELSPDTAAVGLDGPAGVRVSGIGGARFTWYAGDFTGPGLPGGPLRLRLVVPSTREEREVRLALRLDASYLRPRLGGLGRGPLGHATADVPWVFPLVLPADPAASPATPSTRVASHRAERLCLVADVERYSRFTPEEAKVAQARFVEVLRVVLAHAGVEESAVARQKAGDGQFAVLPSGLDPLTAVPRLVEGFALALRGVNLGLDARSRLRLRVALDRGVVEPGVNGWVGDATIAVNRLVDSRVLREALRDAPRADHALALSDGLHRAATAPGPGLSGFHRALVEVPEKGFSAPAWLRVPTDE
ncbi:hypothetical protein KCV87_11890 [Actinosynnema pretiosum subsp. pretiosum]|uniref:Guanylate cyclase domain-containing protein n=1 Tax=Actinosynnema pretiosum subsp. pretiosum TaxID=103721 RepID=A0AA45LAH3_9PSEU|nr:hypothetical protein KCV87_11890 [Actinosynnema pretiosum subsp. pretiosum]